MTTSEEHSMWDTLNIAYETAYANNPLKKACITHALSLLAPNSRVLDIGCGTGVPVAQMLAAAGMRVTGTDVAPKMVAIAKERVPEGTFVVADMVEYEPDGVFEAVFVVYSHLGLTYRDFHAAISRLLRHLAPDGLLVIGQTGADEEVPLDAAGWDATRTYVEGYDLPFWGEPFPTLTFTRGGQRKWLESAGLEVMYDEVAWFQPGNEKCDPEHQQYIIGRRKGGAPVREPMPLPV